MAEGGDDKDQKTEDPTQKKLDDARKKGDVAKSQDLVSWMMLSVATLIIATMATSSVQSLGQPLTGMLANADRIPVDAAGLTQLLLAIAFAIAAALGLPMVGLWLAGIAGNLIQHGFLISGESLKPKLSKLSPLAGFKRLFGKEALVNFIKGLLKIGIFGAVMFAVIWPQRSIVDAMIRMDVAMLLPQTLWLVILLMAAVAAVLLIVAIGDYAYQYFAWYERQRMSFQELKEEFKNSDGNPEVKGKIKQLRRERASKRMMQNLPQATVVITNPTHFAVALKYEPGMTAPVCVAKGVDLVAKRIREKAQDHDIPLVENPPLARALHAGVEIDDEIPEEHYKAVAEVIGYVLKLKGLRR